MYNPFVLFKCGQAFYLESDLKRVTIKDPVRMSIQDILSMHDINTEFDIERLNRIEKEEQIQFKFYKLKYIKDRGEKLRAVQCATVPGTITPKFTPKHIINIGELYEN